MEPEECTQPRSLLGHLLRRSEAHVFEVRTEQGTDGDGIGPYVLRRLVG